MLSSRFKFIYLHVPKTGGNSINRALLPFCDDEMYCEKYHDGVNTFGIRGAHSRDKHATLSVYASYLGEALSGYRVMISVRHPFVRALSFYFSPHRWWREQADGTWELEQAHWDDTLFQDVLGRIPASLSYLDVAARPNPDIVIRTETLHSDMVVAARQLGLPPAPFEALPYANASAAPDDVFAKCLASRDLRDHVEAYFADDMNAFGYESYHLHG